MVEISVCVGLGACPEETLAFARAHVGDMFGEVCDSLLGFEFVG